MSALDAEDGLCRILSWDSDFFQRRIARARDGGFSEAQIVDLIRWCERHQVECLYLLASSSDRDTVRRVEHHGFELTDVRVTLGRSLRDAPLSNGKTRPAESADVEALRRIAMGAHTDSRFYVDGRFPRERCDALYATWIEQSCRGQAGITLVAGPSGNPGGYVTANVADGVGRIGLMAVAADARKQGTGRALVESALAWMSEQSARDALVTTQGRNIPAQALYQSCGFTTVAMDLWYHRWFTPGDETAR